MFGGDVPFCAALFTSGVLLFAQTYRGGYVWDDRAAIVGNADVTGDGGLELLFAHDFWGQGIHLTDSHKSYRPITTLSFRLNHTLHGLHASWYHVLNVAIYGCVVLLVYTVALQWLTSKPTARVAAVLFCFHPVHVEAVASLVGRADSLCGLFYLLSIVCHTHAMRLPPPRGDVLPRVMVLASLLLALLATLSKEIGLTAFGALAVLEVAHAIRVLEEVKKKEEEEEEKEKGGGDEFVGAAASSSSPPCNACFRGVWTVFVVEPSSRARIGVILSTFAILTILRLHLNGPQKLYSWSVLENHVAQLPSVQSRALSYAQTHFWYASKLLFPRYLCFDYGFTCLPSVHELLDWRNILPFVTYVVVGATAGAAVIYARVGMLVGMLLLLLPLVPALNIFFPIGTALAERLLFMPSVGFCFLVAEMVVIDLGPFWENAQSPTAWGVTMSPTAPPPPPAFLPRVRFELEPAAATKNKQTKKTLEKVRQVVVGPSSPPPPSPQKQDLPRPLLLFISFCCLMGTLRIITRNEDWNSEPRIYQSALHVCPLSAKALTNFAVLCATEKNTDELGGGGWNGQSLGNCLAAAHAALQVYQSQYAAHINAGVVHSNIGRTFDSLHFWSHAAGLDNKEKLLGANGKGSGYYGSVLSDWAARKGNYLSAAAKTALRLEAERALDKALGIGFEPPFILLSRGLAAIEAASGDVPGLPPSLPLPTLDLARRCLHLALVKIVEAGKLSPDAPQADLASLTDVTLGLGMALHLLGRHSEALWAFRIGLSCDPANTALLSNAADVQRDRGNYRAAILLGRLALARNTTGLNGDDAEKGLMGLVPIDGLEWIGLDVGVRAGRRRDVQLSPTASAPLWNNLGLSYMRVGDTSSAKECFEAALSSLDEESSVGGDARDYGPWVARKTQQGGGNIEAVVRANLAQALIQET